MEDVNEARPQALWTRKAQSTKKHTPVLGAYDGLKDLGSKLKLALGWKFQVKVH